MSLFTEALPWLVAMRDAFGSRFSFTVSQRTRQVPLNMAYDAALEELQLSNAKLLVRLHRSKQHNRAVTRQLLELRNELQTTEKERDYWQARAAALAIQQDTAAYVLPPG